MKKHTEGDIHNMSQTEKDYQQLFFLARHARILNGINHLLDWDQETYMPKGAAPIRAVQHETLAGLIHSEKTGKKYSTALAKLIDIRSGKVKVKGLNSAKQAALREWRRDYLKDKALPEKFVTDFAKLTSESVMAWRDAKQNDSFKQFAPFLKRIVEMNRKKADYFKYENEPYDALIDQFEPGISTETTASVFATLRKAIVALLAKLQKSKQINDGFLHGNFDHQKQLDFSHKILEDMGYTSLHGRLDISSHPFSSASHPTDSRITTRIHPTCPISCISVILHEAGHALYEMGLPVEEYGSPLGDAISLGMHESQSRWWETRIGQSKAFWQHYLPLLRKAFKGKFDDVSLDTFYKAINKVTPSLIRVDADEVTYPLHVILRFELERDLINGKLKPADIPEAWNSKMTELLGMTPKNNKEGCLQDIHWAMGAFGYFPTYSLGNIYAAQLFEVFEKEHTDWEKRTAKGDLKFIVEWLRENVHQHGRRYSSQEILKRTTGKTMNADPYIKYLERKYAKVYEK